MVDLLFGFGVENLQFVLEQYKRYKSGEKVPDEWDVFLRDFDESSLDDIVLDLKGPQWGRFRKSNQIIGLDEEIFQEDRKKVNEKKNVDIESSTVCKNQDLKNRMFDFIDQYRRYGYKNSMLDPLSLQISEYCAELNFGKYFKDDEKNKKIDFGGILSCDVVSPLELDSLLKQVYTSSISVEYMHLEQSKEREWFATKFEGTIINFSCKKEEKIGFLDQITEMYAFEKFLHTKFPGAKRFSGEGAEGLIVMLNEIIARSADSGICDLVFGMAHRARLSVLATVLRKDYATLLSEFMGVLSYTDNKKISGDVKYHTDFSNDMNVDGKKVHVSLLPNPSHLETVNSILLGYVRGKQDSIKDTKREKVLGVIIHGDAGFAGQGVVSECINMYGLKGYHTGGTIHIIINNQLGFTTKASDGSTKYTSDIAKGYDIPVIHVNADDIENIALIIRFAFEYRAKFKKDILIDLVCYRRYGHNEVDEPRFTHPLMYAEIDKHKSVSDLYNERLVSESVITPQYYDNIKKKYNEILVSNHEKAEFYKSKSEDLCIEKQKFSEASIDIALEFPKTGVDKSKLKKISSDLYNIPKTANINPKLISIISLRDEKLQSGKEIDWASAEALAYASLLKEGVDIRLSGQDTCRGTFSHRHSILSNVKTDAKYNLYGNISKNKFEVIDSPLSEYSVMGFEYGYNMVMSNNLVIWEAQFGDFANTAQVIVDQYISSAEQKWLKYSSLVLLLPHGYEGNGPEHSSARMERYLQLCAQFNMRVVNCSVPANFFHVIRRQIISECKKPLVVFSPKSLLRHKYAVSKLEEFDKGKSFLPVIDDNSVTSSKVNKIILCSGKVYYDLLKIRDEDKNLKNVAIIRLEQYYPFPLDHLISILSKYKKSVRVVWSQEENKNMGAWFFINPLMEEVLMKLKFDQSRILYTGRPEGASPSCASVKVHEIEQEKLLNDAFTL